MEIGDHGAPTVNVLRKKLEFVIIPNLQEEVLLVQVADQKELTAIQQRTLVSVILYQYYIRIYIQRNNTSFA